MSKRLAEEDAETSINTKRIRSTQKEGHVSDCNDPECEGCDVGEIEISFVHKDKDGNDQTSKPSAHDLLSMAVTEADTDQKSEIVRRLFDMALEQFEKIEPEDRAGYATCLVELGRAIDVEESLREALDIFRGIVKKDASAMTSEHWLTMAKAATGLLILIRKRLNGGFEELLEELEEDAPSEEQLRKYSLKREEINLYKEAVNATEKALASPNDLPSKEARFALHDLHSYAQLLDHPQHLDHVSAIADVLTRSIQQFSYHKDADLLALKASTLIHKQNLLADDVEIQKELCNESEKLLLDANKFYKEEHKNEYPRGWELLAMLQLNQSNLLDDEDEVVKKYDEAVESFKTAHKLNPDNTELENMVNMLSGESQEEDEEEGEEE
ncbi:hypothetical protein BDB00DRAFT_784243 [Zychaea mexicana]|uniref:uncharacterized protein n=1 Tax=Zychaea mexicana TaxID=64656 RepID=UPI0022FE88C3|nr:uncharacterized protein BDB00DRAFT_784243 [Zychaea mexicana]KAI9498179.1 hypothetical protein BDB00DRAFT_784243 [Zychaea mexicana]